MRREPENPRAFPSGWPERDTYPGYGMTLRDWFASQMLPAIWSTGRKGYALNFDADQDALRHAARSAYAFADAMLTARQSNKETADGL